MLIPLGVSILLALLAFLTSLKVEDKFRPPDLLLKPRFVWIPMPDGTTLMVSASEVTWAQWQPCVSAKKCPDIRIPKGAASDHPVIGVNWFDANVYASWLAERTGLDVRLPQQHEWVAFAADHAPHPKPKLFTDPRMAWAAEYDITARIPDSRTRPARGFGQNNVGLYDLKGNVWEWTATDCADAGGRAARAACNGGGRMVMGEHLAILSDLVRDPGNASCGGGIPPANLGFRVVY